jgi:beta-lactamase superfamily II metal-dependent hydrolase
LKISSIISSKVKESLFLIVAIVAVLAMFLIPSLRKEVYPEFYDNLNSYFIFLDVGQADSTLIMSKQMVILVDVGSDIETVSKLDKYLPPDERNIDLLIITHPHQDHIGGYDELALRYNIDKIVVNPVCSKDELWNLILNNKRVENIDEIGREIRIGDLDFKFDENLSIKQSDEVSTKLGVESSASNIAVCDVSFDNNFNDDSLVTLITSKENHKVLLMGDLETTGEKAIGNELFEDVDILKAGHHCSKTSTSQELLNFVRPELVVCSVGKDNKYGHPSKKVLDRLGVSGIKYDVTYETGDIVIPVR